MRMLNRLRRNRLRPYGAGAVVFFLCLSCSFFVITISHATQEVIYKGPRVKKALLPSEVSLGNTAQTTTQSIQGYVYDPTGKTDPFKSFIAEQESVEEKKKRKPRTYLETLDLSQLDLVAIILSKQGNWAMVRDSKGLGYVIKKGTPIGINEGVVHEIKDNEIVVREKYRNVRKNKLEYKDTAKKLLSFQKE
jgi:type IV pilus assembly protein PilP